MNYEPQLEGSYLDDEEMGLMLTNDLIQMEKNNNQTLSEVSPSILDHLNFSTSSFLSTSKMQFSTSANFSMSPYSTDSLDKSLGPINCDLNKANYTLAFSTEKPKRSLPSLDFLHPKITQKPAKKRPLSCPVDNLCINSIKDWDSLKFLLPSEYKDMKPEYLREKGDEEKEQDTSEVVFREKKREKKCRKRFSLQEIEEVSEVCKGIEETLRIVEEKESRAPPTTLCISHTHLTNPINAAIKNLKTLPRTFKIYSNSQHGAAVLESLCPALYCLFSDGLCQSIDTLWGKVPNSVWRVIEGSVSGAPTTQILSELVLRINSETDLMAEGPLKFNAFICGILNLGTLPHYLTLLQTKDLLLRTHYTPTGFLHNANTTNKSIYKSLLNNLQTLTNFSYSLDIFHEVKTLHTKINKMKRSWSDERPKTTQSRLPKSKTLKEIKVEDKFKMLKEQWELMASRKELVSPTGSRIPRLLKNEFNRKVKGGVK